ncbi:MAG: hypothetical protein INQ03_07625 [Candidatus Heimdallarchaeota archaeon]|nr:hypothetical protein [Candidatus Heimdallarchaeota archaeon]
MEDTSISVQFLDDTERVGELLLANEQVLQIIYQDTADALIAASIFARTLHDLQLPCVISNLDENKLDTIVARGKHLSIFIGFSHEELESLEIKGKVISITDFALDEYTSNIDEINLATYNYSNNKGTLSAAAYFVCSAIAPDLSSIIHLPLVAASCQFEYQRLQGLSKSILEDAIEGNVVSVQKHLSFLGTDSYTISESLIYSLKPFLPGITGNAVKALELLTKSDIEEQIKGKKRRIVDLSKDEIKDLNSNLIVQLALHKGYQEERLEFIKEKITLLQEADNSILRNTWDFAAAVTDAINRKKSSIAFSVLLGNRTDQYRQLSKIFDEERRSVANSYQFIQDHPDDVIELSALRYVIGDKKMSWYNASEIAAMAISHGLVTPEFPCAVITPGPDDLMTIGIRASKNHKLPNLKELMEKLVEERGLDVIVDGSMLKCELSVSKADFEGILFDINSSIKEIMMHEVQN